MVNLVIFWKPETCDQTVLPDRSLSVGQTLMENAKIEKCNATVLNATFMQFSNIFCALECCWWWRLLHQCNFHWLEKSRVAAAPSH